MEKWKITCLRCKNDDIIQIVKDQDIIWGDNKHVVSGRKRLDGNWGWQCFCGNNSLLTSQEMSNISNLQTPDPKEIQDVIDNLKVEKDKKFVMERG